MPTTVGRRYITKGKQPPHNSRDVRNVTLTPPKAPHSTLRERDAVRQRRSASRPRCARETERHEPLSALTKNNADTLDSDNDKMVSDRAVAPVPPATCLSSDHTGKVA